MKYCIHEKQSYSFVFRGLIYHTNLWKCEDCGAFSEDKIKNTSEIRYNKHRKHHYQLCESNGFEFNKIYIDGKFKDIYPTRKL